MFEGPSRPHKAPGSDPADSTTPPPPHPPPPHATPQESQPVAARSDVNHKHRHRVLSYANNKLAQVRLVNALVNSPCPLTLSIQSIDTLVNHSLSAHPVNPLSCTFSKTTYPLSHTLAHPTNSPTHTLRYSIINSPMCAQVLHAKELQRRLDENNVKVIAGYPINTSHHHTAPTYLSNTNLQPAPSTPHPLPPSPLS